MYWFNIWNVFVIELLCEICTFSKIRNIKKIVKKKARTVLTSGGLEPVSDVGGGNNSVFASSFLNALRNNNGVLDGNQLFSIIRKQVMLNSDQTPEYGDIRKAGHDGGDFIFVKKQN